MDYTPYFILFMIIISFAVMTFLLNKRIKGLGEKPKDEQSLLLLQNQLNEIRRELDHKLGELPKMMQQQFGQSAQIIREVTERLTKLDETNNLFISFIKLLILPISCRIYKTF